MEKKIRQAQRFLKERHVDGWLLYDFHGNNELARHFLGIVDQTTTRRFFYWIPVQGQPVKIVHLIESHVLDHCPGSQKTFLSWQSLEEELRLILRGCRAIVMEFFPKKYHSKYLSS
jgi:hypothetical protein